MPAILEDDPECPTCGSPYLGPTSFPKADSRDAACIWCGKSAPPLQWVCYPVVADARQLPPIGD
ncbi:hypothetical protein ABMA59_19325 [Mesorhizobium sp. CN2-181]